MSMSTWEKIKFSTTAFLGKILEKLFGAPELPIGTPASPTLSSTSMTGPRTPGQLNPDWNNHFGFSGSKLFMRSSSEIRGFEFGASTSFKATVGLSPVPYPGEVAFQQYL